MRTGQVPGKPDVSTACWAAALECLRAGAPTPQVVAALRVAGPARAQMAIRLKTAKTTITIDPNLSAQQQLSELREVRRAELEDPIVEAADRYARQMSALLGELRPLEAQRQTLAADLRVLNQKIRLVERAGIGDRTRLVAQHDSLKFSLRDLSTAMLATVNRFESIHVDFTTLCDRGLLRSGHTVKSILELGGVPRGQSTVYRVHQKEKSPRPSDWEFYFSPTLLEVLPRLKAGQEALVEFRASIAADLVRLARQPGQTDIEIS